MAQTPKNRTAPWWSQMLMYWLENQVTMTFHSDISFYSDQDLSISKGEIIDSLKLDGLNQFLNARGFNLKSFTQKDVPRPKDDESPPTSPPEDSLTSPVGKYLFPASQGTTVLCFFHIEQVEIPHPIQEMMSMSHCDESNTHRIVNLVNRNLDKLRMEGQVPIVAAMPNWLGGSTGCITHNCPVMPPIPVPADSSCASARGLWPITLPDLSSDMQGRTGEGVTVFVLDSMPDIENLPTWISNVASGAGANNKLLQKIDQQMRSSEPPFVKLTYQRLSEETLENNAPDQPITGKDLYGRLYGFKSPDHGLFVTGIIRDLAPQANIEYIRVLNDFGVGTVAVLCKTLEDIQGRMSAIDPKTGKKGDLYNKPVVINLSLVSLPAHDDLVRIWFGNDCSCNANELVEIMYFTEQLRVGLHRVIQSLTASGAVVAASAGNDSNAQQWQGAMAENMRDRAPTRYPAAFPEVIAVGAIDKDGMAAPYSNYPQLPPRNNGIATYGGGIPKPVPHPGSMTTADPATIDSLRGLYSSSTYPALSADDVPDEYPAPNQNAWAYWSGTSFATPIISAVAARVLEKLTPADPTPLASRLWATEVQRAITTAAGQREILTGDNPLPPQPDFGFGVSMLRAYQCVRDDEGAEEGEEKTMVLEEMTVID